METYHISKGPLAWCRNSIVVAAALDATIRMYRQHDRQVPVVRILCFILLQQLWCSDSLENIDVVRNIDGYNISMREIAVMSLLLFSSATFSLVVPPNVTRLGMSCFRECSALTSVVFQQSITSATVGTQQTSVELGDVCFKGCWGLRSVRLPSSLLAIPAWCFGECHGLTDIFIPKLVRAIHEMAFNRCTNLRSMDLSNNNNLDALGARLFQNCTSLESITIRSSSSHIQFGKNIFIGCSLLSFIKVYPNDDPSFIYKFFHQYHHQIVEEEGEVGVVTRQHRNGRRRRLQRHPQKRQRL